MSMLSTCCILWRLGNLFRSRKWNEMSATVLGPHLSKGTNTTVRVDYEYAINGQTYADSFEKPFLSDSSALAYTEQFPKGALFKIRFKPANPAMSVADSSVENWALWWG